VDALEGHHVPRPHCYRVSKPKETVLHTRTQRDLYTIALIVWPCVFESNEPWRSKAHRGPSLIETSEKGDPRANQYADSTSSDPSLDEFGQPANVAAQPKLGLLSEWGSGSGRNNPARIVASWKNLKSLRQLEATSETGIFCAVSFNRPHDETFQAS
jgi:hypothetical protein